MLLKMPVFLAVPFTGVLFLICHFPNIVLMFAVFAMEQILLLLFAYSGWWFLAAIPFTHALLAVCLYNFFPASITKGFQVWTGNFKASPIGG
jgi:hypothetical protein